MLEQMGRNSTLTGRTEVWHAALSIAESPLVGTGFESFWIGSRYDRMAELTHMYLNQAHNGYIEVYINLGWIGIAVLGFVILTTYRRIVKAIYSMTPAASLRLAFFIIAISQNFTEASFKIMTPVWSAFLLAAMVSTKVASAVEVPFAPGLNRVDDLAERKPVAAKSPVLAGSRIAHSDHRKSIVRAKR
jgi:O-antigen ligase